MAPQIIIPGTAVYVI